MKFTINLFLLICFITSCSKDDIPETNCQPNEIPVIECVTDEEITSTQSDFLILNKGLQTEGIGKGIKINEEWESSLYINISDSIFTFFLETYWYDSLSNSYALAENMVFAEVPIYNSSNCYFLTSDTFPTNIDSIYCVYNINDGDTRVFDYQLDTTQDNKLEILEFDKENKILKAKLKASFITDESINAAFPEQVCFFNVDVITN